MAETITLRAYLDEVKGKLERGATTEVISHCHYILQHFPQNVDTYRLLGQALLQKAQDEGNDDLLKEAAEIFQRALGVVPNDYLAHLGLSEIREAQGELNQALWHMERAYEQIPGNQVLQEALRGLYAKREGNAPEKIQLTRAALARQYATGQLYDQALIELRNALERNPDRLDLKVMLAETLWESHHPIEAGELAVEILKLLPSCLAANRILARLWLDNERPSDAQVFLDRLEALDPYAAAQVIQPDTRVSDPNLLARLDYGAQARAGALRETPDWVQDLGDLGEAVDLSSVFQVSPEQPVAGFQGIDTGSAPPGSGAVPEWASAPDEPGMPDWFSDSGPSWEAGDSAAQPAAPLEADWLAAQPSAPSFGQPPAESPEIHDWFSEVLATDSATPPSDQAALDADWLMGPGVGEVALPSFGDTADAADQAPVEMDWLMGEAEAAASPDSFETLFDAAPAMESDSEITAGAPEDRAPSGFTDLLAGVDALRVASGPMEDEEEAPLTPPGWLAAFEEEPRSAQAEAGDADEWPGTEPETEMVDLSAEAEWTARFGASEPSDEAPAALEDDMAFLAAFDEPLEAASAMPEVGSMAGEETLEDMLAALPQIGGEDFLSGLEVPGQLESMPEAQPADWMLEPESDFFAPPAPLGRPPLAEDEPQETAEADWLTPLDAADEGEWLVASTETPVMGAEDATAEPLPASDDWGLAEEEAFGVRAEDLTEQQDAGEAERASAEEFMPFDLDSAADEMPLASVWTPLESELEFPVDEPGTEIERDWQQPSVLQDDWLGAFAKPTAEMPGVTGLDLPAEDMNITQDDLDALFADDTAPDLGQAAQPDQAAEPATAQEVADTDTWLSAMPELELESVSDAPDEAMLSFDTLEDAGFETGQLSEAAGTLFAAEDSVSAASEPDLEATSVSFQAAAQDDDAPAWMADLKPVEALAPSGSDADDWLTEPYDPFESGSADKVPEYRSARETGILQPNESPDWMTAFTGEELPAIEEEPAVADAGEEDLLAALGLEATEPEPRTPPSVAERMAPLDVDDMPTDQMITEDFSIDSMAPPSEEEGAMPDWLVAITRSEADKLDEMAFEDAADRGSTAAAGAVQQDSEFDWLVPFGEAADADQREDAQADLAGAAGPVGEALGQMQSLETLFDEVDAGEGAAAGAGDFSFDDLDLARSEPEDAMPIPEEASSPEFEFAQPDDLAHTKAVDTAAIGATVEDESVVEDFSFGDDLVPRWLRKPKEQDSTSPARSEPPTTPDWLRGVFEDEEPDQ